MLPLCLMRFALCRLEPAALTLNVSSDELFIALGEVDDSFDQADYATDSAGHKSNHNLDDPLSRITENKLMNTEAPEQNAADARRQLLIGPLDFPIRHSALIYRRHRLIGGAWTKSSLAS